MSDVKPGQGLGVLRWATTLRPPPPHLPTNPKPQTPKTKPQTSSSIKIDEPKEKTPVFFPKKNYVRWSLHPLWPSCALWLHDRRTPMYTFWVSIFFRYILVPLWWCWKISVSSNFWRRWRHPFIQEKRSFFFYRKFPHNLLRTAILPGIHLNPSDFRS